MKLSELMRTYKKVRHKLWPEHEWIQFSVEKDTWLSEIQSLTEQLAIAKEALEFYAPSNSYDYDKVQGSNYIWNDQGAKARTALSKINGEKEE